MEIRQKVILLLAPEPWGSNKVSKHHYAQLLAKLGNQVYFLEPAQTSGDRQVKVEPIEEGLYSVRYKALSRGANRLPRQLRSFYQQIDARRKRPEQIKSERGW